MEWSSLGKLLIGLGALLGGIGLLLVLVDRVPLLGTLFGWIGKLPGDISIKRENFSFYIPLGTSVVLSLLLSLVFYLLSWLFRR